MITMSSAQDNNGLDCNMPLWKKELILRRRAVGKNPQSVNSCLLPLSRTNAVVTVSVSELSEPAVQDVIVKQYEPLRTSTEESLDQAQADFHLRGGKNKTSFSPTGVRPAVVSNMRLVEHLADSGSGLMINGGDSNCSVVPRAVKYYADYAKMGEEKSNKRTNVTGKIGIDNSAMNIVRNRIINENNNFRNVDNEDYQSDSSEELQYGPGIVSKLKNKYLSLTLRESKNRGVRPSLSNIRKYSSLENLLDSDLEPGKPQINHFIKKTDVANNVSKSETSHHQRFRPTNRRKESMKRARSVETLHKYDNRAQIVAQDIVSNDSINIGATKNTVRDVNKNRPTGSVNPLINEELVIIENKTKMDNTAKRTENKVPATQSIKVHVKRVQLGVIPPEGELPPPDTVNQRLKIFESSTGKKYSRPLISNKVNNIHYRNNVTASHQENVNFSGILKAVPSVNNKSVLSCKPNLNSEKARQTVPPRLVSAAPYTPVDNFHQVMAPSVHTRPGNLVLDTIRSKPVSPDLSPSVNQKFNMSSPTLPVKRFTGPSIGRDCNAENTATSPVLETIQLTNGKAHAKSSSDLEDENEDVPDSTVKHISKSAMENIRKDGLSLQYSFSGINNSNKVKFNYLPNQNTTILNKTTKEVAPSVSKISNQISHSKPADSPHVHVKQVGVIRPIPINTNKVHLNSQTSFTDLEKEKNHINLVKSSEQSSDKTLGTHNLVLDSNNVNSDTYVNVKKNIQNKSESVFGEVKDSSTGLWEKKPWNQQDNTMVFDFRSRQTVPDYIEDDGIRRRRSKPKVGEDVVILGDISTDESTTDYTEDDPLQSNRSPSPCNLVFIGDNILINGKSSLMKKPKRQKLNVSFNDSMTSTFEYPSELSQVDEESPVSTNSPSISLIDSHKSVPTLSSNGPTPGVPVPLGGSSLASYTPSKVHLGSDDFQLGVTRTAPLVPRVSSPSKAIETKEDEVDDDYLKPAEDGDTVTWSSETAADLLF